MGLTLFTIMAIQGTINLMATRVQLSIDKQNRMSVGKLGFTEGYAIAEELDDGSGWVVRPAVLLTEAELDVLSNQDNVDDIRRSLDDLRNGRTVPRHRR